MASGDEWFREIDEDRWAVDVSEADRAELAAVMGVGVEEAAPFAAAAVREVEEEAGVRLAVADLRGRAHWVTPAFEPRRYDTWILAAAMPPGQEARETSTESDASGWVAAADLLARHTAGQVRMLPPTVVSLQQLLAGRLKDLQEQRETERVLRLRAPRIGRGTAQPARR